MIEDAKSLLYRSRIVTLTGAPGVGKTSAAVEVGVRCMAKFPGGVWFSDLTDVRDLEGLVERVCRDVGISPSFGDVGLNGWLDSVGVAMRTRGASLLILDNFEQLVALSPRTIVRWATLAPALRFLVTSRERLNIAGEVTKEVLPLDMSAASELFRDVAARAGRPIAPAEYQTVGLIVERLDFIPLAIELVAPWARSRVLNDLYSELKVAPLLIANRARRDSDARHESLLAAVDWSWKMLTTEEQSALLHSGCFSGGFARSAAHAVLGAAGIRQVDEVLAGLVEKSLLRFAPTETQARFVMYEYIREFAIREARDWPDRDTAILRHAEYYARLAETWCRRDRRGDTAVALARSFDSGNLEATLRNALVPDPLRLSAGVSLFDAWSTTRPLSELDLLAAELVALGERSGNVAGLDLAYRRMAHVRRAQGLHEESIRMWQNALDMARRRNSSDDGICIAAAGWDMHALGRDAEAIAAYEEGMNRMLEVQDRHQLAECHSGLGKIFLYMGDFDRAAIEFTAALQEAIELEDNWTLGIATGDHGHLCFMRGLSELARQHFSDAIEILACFGHDQMTIEYELYLGRCCQRLHEDRLALHHFERSWSGARASQYDAQACSALYWRSVLLIENAAELAATALTDLQRAIDSSCADARAPGEWRSALIRVIACDEDSLALDDYERLDRATSALLREGDSAGVVTLVEPVVRFASLRRQSHLGGVLLGKLGLCLFAVGRISDAVSCFQEATELADSGSPLDAFCSAAARAEIRAAGPDGQTELRDLAQVFSADLTVIHPAPGS